MRRNLLSCTSLARHGLLALATALSTAPEPAFAADLTLTQALSAWFDFNHQEFAVLTTALALLGFTVVAAILLMRTRVRATRTELRLRADVAGLQDQADRLRALLFAEPQILIAWAAGENRPQISGDTSLLISPDAAQNSPQQILAFGTWLPPEPALQMDHAVDALREAGEGFLLNLSTSNGRAIEAMGRAIGGQAIVRIRELGGLRRELAESNLRYKTLQEETELLRDFAAAAPGRSGPRARKAIFATPIRPMCGPPRGRRRRRDPAQPRTARNRPAYRHEPNVERQFHLQRAAADRGRRRAAHLRRTGREAGGRQRRHRDRRQRGHLPAPPWIG